MHYDFIVIGSGFGGSVSAMRLAEKGYRVLILEQGKRYRPEDFPRTNWNLRKYLWWPALGFHGIQKLSFYRQASILTGTGYGGGSLVYANTLFKPPEKFFSHLDGKCFPGWEKRLEPFYEEAAFMTGRTLYNRINPEDRALRNVAGRMNAGDTFQNVYVGVYLNDKDKEEKDPYFNGHGPIRRPCTECAGCMVGCRENAKNTLDMNYLWFAEKLGVEVLTETRADRIEFEKGIYRVLTRKLPWSKNGRTGAFSSDQIIISAGTLGTLELLLRQKHKYRTLPLLPDCLGENLLTNSETLCAVSGSKTKLNNGVAISSVFHPDEETHIEIVKYPDGSNAMKWFFSLAARGGVSNFRRVLRLLKVTILHPWQFLRTVFNFKWSTGLVIFLVMQTVENSMKIIWKKGFFRQGMKIINQGKNKVPAYIETGQKVMEAYAKEVGGISQNIILELMLDRPTTAHILGGCLMGEDGTNSVVGKDLRVHAYPGLYIIDGSVMQANPGVNPSFTILAMAEYAMSEIGVKPGHIYKPLSESIKRASHIYL